MSFAELLAGDYVPKLNKFTIEHEGKTFNFTAHELPYLEEITVGVAQHKGLNPFAAQIARSIKDETGNYMTYEQAVNLPEELAQRFLEESGKVNKRESEKN